MTAAVLRSSPNLAVPQTQNTAPVFEFNCLYTHDLRRKQKRWQDGFLRYHTFNKRVMVYDVPRNFLGDLHWTSGDDLQEGDEMTLEKGGIMVQVSERIGTIQTDLSDLLQRKDKTPAKTPAPRTIMRHGTPLSAAQSVTPRTPNGISKTPMKHKSLNALLGRSRRPIGKASLPAESPFEVRNRDVRTVDAQEEASRKRPRLDSDIQARKAKKHRDQTPEQQRRNSVAIPNQGCQVIDLSSDTEDIAAAQAASHAIEAELLATSSPARLHESPAPRQVRPNHFRSIDRRPAAVQQAVIESLSVKVPSQKALADLPAPGSVSEAAPARPAKQTSVTRDTSKQKSAEVPADESFGRSSLFGPESDSQARGKSLKLVGGAPRKMLLFQSQNSRQASSEAETVRGMVRDRAQSTRREASPGQPKEAPRPVQATKEPMADQPPEESVFQRRMQERLVKISNKNKRTGLQRSSSDVTEQRTVNDKAPDTVGLRKTTSVVMSRLDSPEDPTPADFAFPDMTPLDFDDPIIDDSVAQPPTRKINEPVSKASRPNGRGSSTISARSFKPLTVKPVLAAPVAPAASVMTSKAAKMIAAEEKKNQDTGPWSKEACDLMDWRPPNMQPKVGESA